MKPLSAFLLTSSIFSFLGWLYVVVIQIVHPTWILYPLSHWTTWLRLDNFGMLCFIASFISLFGFLSLKDHKI